MIMSAPATLATMSAPAAPVAYAEAPPAHRVEPTPTAHRTGNVLVTAAILWLQAGTRVRVRIGRPVRRAPFPIETLPTSAAAITGRATVPTMEAPLGRTTTSLGGRPAHARGVGQQSIAARTKPARAIKAAGSTSAVAAAISHYALQIVKACAAQAVAPAGLGSAAIAATGWAVTRMTVLAPRLQPISRRIA